MKYKISYYGPFGPRQTGKEITRTFDSDESRKLDIIKMLSPGSLVNVRKTWEECDYCDDNIELEKHEDICKNCSNKMMERSKQ